MTVSVGFLPRAYAGIITLPNKVFPWRGGQMMASFLILPTSSSSIASIINWWKGVTSSAGIMTRENRLSDLRVSDSRRMLGEIILQLSEENAPEGTAIFIAQTVAQNVPTGPDIASRARQSRI